MNPLSLITVAGVSDLEERFSSELSARPDVHLFLRCVDRVEVLAAIRAGQIAAIACFGAPGWFDRQCVEEAAHAGIAVVMVTHDPLAVLAAEQRELPVLPEEISCDELLAHLSAPASDGLEAAPDPTRARGKLIAVWGPKGAPGRTTVAIELAYELAADEPRTLLIDADPYGGDVLQLLGMTEELPTVVWASRLAHRDELTPGALAAELRRAGPAGPVVLPGLPRSRSWPEVSGFGFRSLIEAARELFETVVVDVGFDLAPDPAAIGVGEGPRNEMAQIAVAGADHVVAVCGGDPLSLKHFIRTYEDIQELVEADLVTVVVNKARPADHRSIAALINEHIGKRVAHFIPIRSDDARRAVMAGMPVKEAIRRSEITSAMREIAAGLGGKVEQRGFLTRFASRI